jgi:hypothetical protein
MHNSSMDTLGAIVVADWSAGLRKSLSGENGSNDDGRDNWQKTIQMPSHEKSFIRAIFQIIEITISIFYIFFKSFKNVLLFYEEKFFKKSIMGSDRITITDNFLINFEKATRDLAGKALECIFISG